MKLRVPSFEAGICRTGAGFFLFCISLAAFQAGPGPARVVTGSELIREGRLQEALAGYLQAAQVSPKSVNANTGTGIVLDLLGRYAEARKYLAQAIQSASNSFEKAQVQRVLAVSFGFSGDCRGAEKADRGAYEYYLQAPDFYSAGEVADEVGRLCLDAGALDTAYSWYRSGHDAGLRETDIPSARKDLWEFRWDHARARIAARRGQTEQARKFVAAAKTILDRGMNPDQQVYFSYLTGYVAFYAGDYAAALAALQTAAQTDPFVQCLMAQCYERLGDRARALDYYHKAAGATAHSVPAAFARPFASARLE